MLQGMAALKMMNGLEDQEYVHSKVTEIVNKSLTQQERTELEKIYPLEVGSDSSMERWKEISKEASSEVQLVYPSQTLNKIIEVNCKDLSKYRRECKILVGFLREEMSDISVRLPKP
jgi:hypothetical protein